MDNLILRIIDIHKECPALRLGQIISIAATGVGYRDGIHLIPDNELLKGLRSVKLASEIKKTHNKSLNSDASQTGL